MIGKPIEYTCDGKTQTRCEWMDCQNLSKGCIEGRIARGMPIEEVLSPVKHTRVEVDITGQRFGKLVVLKKSDASYKGVYLWTCQCDCGTIKDCRKYNLMRGEIQSCGCVRKENLFGKRDYKAKQVECNGVSQTVREWADCQGLNKDKIYGRLAKGIPPEEALTKSDMRGKKTLKDLTGQRFGRLTVLKRVPDPGNGSTPRVFWECQCDCGKTVSVRAGALVSGNTTSCGCGRRKTIECGGKTQCVADWCRCTGISKGTLDARLRYGWTIQEALSTQVKQSQPTIDLTGERFGKLTVIRRSERGSQFWLCQCECNEFRTLSTKTLTGGSIVSCGCTEVKRKMNLKKYRCCDHDQTTDEWADCIGVSVTTLRSRLQSTKNIQVALTMAHAHKGMKLRPCPFCGKRDVETRTDGDMVSMICKGCGTEIRTPDIPASKDFLLDRWNTRTYTKSSTLCPECGLLVNVNDPTRFGGTSCPNCHHIFW